MNLAAILIAAFLLLAKSASADTNAFDRTLLDKAVHGEAQALATLQQAAETGDPDAEFAMGEVLMSGGIRNCPAGLEWYRKAAEQGHAVAQGHLSSIYYWGSCTRPFSADHPSEYPAQADNPVDAYYWLLLFEKTKYEYPNLPGHPPPSDFIEVGGDAEQKMLATTNDRYSKGLTPEQIAEIKTRVAKWSPRGFIGSFRISHLLLAGLLSLFVLAVFTFHWRNNIKSGTSMPWRGV
jgi:TPR repeat protein